jgi:hypothetical protein
MPTRDDNESNKTFETLFGEPLLIEGESKEAYMQLYAAIEAEVKPKTIFDKMLVKDLADKYWEEQRLKRKSVDLIEAKIPKALELLLEPTGGYAEDAPKAVQQYFEGTEKDKKAAKARLAAYGITPRHVQAEAIELSRSGLLSIDRMVTARETARRLMRKDLEKRMAIDFDCDSEEASIATVSETQVRAN